MRWRVLECGVKPDAAALDLMGPYGTAREAMADAGQRRTNRARLRWAMKRGVVVHGKRLRLTRKHIALLCGVRFASASAWLQREDHRRSRNIPGPMLRLLIHELACLDESEFEWMALLPDFSDLDERVVRSKPSRAGFRYRAGR